MTLKQLYRPFLKQRPSTQTSSQVRTIALPSLYVDGGIAGTTDTGIAVVLIGANNQIIGLRNRQMPRMTNNEAEYNALLLGLDVLHEKHIRAVNIYSDSEVMVRQLLGQSRVNSSRLKPLFSQTMDALRRLKRYNLQHIRRDRNRLADALAADAINGRLYHV